MPNRMLGVRALAAIITQGWDQKLISLAGPTEKDRLLAVAIHDHYTRCGLSAPRAIDRSLFGEVTAGERVLVVHDRQTPEGEVHAALTLLSERSAKVVGVLVVDVMKAEKQIKLMVRSPTSYNL